MAPGSQAKLEIAERRCLEQGLKLTPQRRQVMALLLEQDDPASAYDLLDALQRRHQLHARLVARVDRLDGLRDGSGDRLLCGGHDARHTTRSALRARAAC